MHDNQQKPGSTLLISCKTNFYSYVIYKNKSFCSIASSFRFLYLATIGSYVASYTLNFQGLANFWFYGFWIAPMKI